MLRMRACVNDPERCPPTAIGERAPFYEIDAFEKVGSGWLNPSLGDGGAHTKRNLVSGQEVDEEFLDFNRGVLHQLFG